MRRQKGMGVIATLMTLVVAIFIAIVALKVVPAYLEYVSIKMPVQPHSDARAMTSSGAGPRAICQSA